MSVGDAHAIVRNALDGVDEDGTPGLHELRLADLNETEREHALRALKSLHQLDAALAARSELARVGAPWNEGVGGEAPQATVTLTKHDTDIPALGETRENWRVAADELDIAARGRTPERALENLIGGARHDDDQGPLSERLEAATDGGGDD